MMNPLHHQPQNPTNGGHPPSASSSETDARKAGLTSWLRQHFGSEPPHRHSENFFISDVTEGGVGSHHRHQLFRSRRR